MCRRTEACTDLLQVWELRNLQRTRQDVRKDWSFCRAQVRDDASDAWICHQESLSWDLWDCGGWKVRSTTIPPSFWRSSETYCKNGCSLVVCRVCSWSHEYWQHEHLGNHYWLWSIWVHGILQPSSRKQSQWLRSTLSLWGVAQNMQVESDEAIWSLRSTPTNWMEFQLS